MQWAELTSKSTKWGKRIDSQLHKQAPSSASQGGMDRMKSHVYKLVSKVVSCWPCGWPLRTVFSVKYLARYPHASLKAKANFLSATVKRHKTLWTWKTAHSIIFSAWEAGTVEITLLLALTSLTHTTSASDWTTVFQHAPLTGCFYCPNMGLPFHWHSKCRECDAGCLRPLSSNTLKLYHT